MNTELMSPVSKSLSLLAVVTLLASMLLQTVASAAETKKVKTGKLVHVVSFKFKDTATPAQVDEVVNAFRDLKKKIKQIQTLEWGTNVSPENLNKGLTHCWILTFKSDKDRDEYLVHPDHKAFGALVGKSIADVFVIDYWASK